MMVASLILPLYYYNNGVSADGSIIVGDNYGSYPIVWRNGTPSILARILGVIESMMLDANQKTIDSSIEIHLNLNNSMVVETCMLYSAVNRDSYLYRAVIQGPPIV